MHISEANNAHLEALEGFGWAAALLYTATGGHVTAAKRQLLALNFL
jgi:hypothetical protein